MNKRVTGHGDCLYLNLASLFDLLICCQSNQQVGRHMIKAMVYGMGAEILAFIWLVPAA
jgi:hypothetical protein